MTRPIQLVSEAALVLAILVVFGPPSIYLSRSVESVFAILLALFAFLLPRFFIGIPLKQMLLALGGLLLLAATLSIDVARNHDVLSSTAFIMPFAELAVFFLAARHSTMRRETIFYLTGVALGMRALIMIYQYLTGSYLDTEMEFSDSLSYTEIGGIVVQRPIDAAVSLFTLAIVAHLVGKSQHKVFLYTLLLLGLASVLMSLTRSLWLAIFLGTVVCLIRFGRISMRGILYFLAIAILVSGMLYLRDPELADTATAIITERVTSTESQLDSDLGRLRLYENEAALKRLENPLDLLFGIGYAGTIDTLSRNMDTLIAVRKQYIHNFHLLVLTKTGIFMFLAYLYFLWRLVVSRNAMVSTFSLGLIAFITFQPVVLAFHLLGLLGLVIGISEENRHDLPGSAGTEDGRVLQ